ncbi:MAG: acyltransferase family protein [Actinomycetia bacterium]|nr:acyltransferase family protein [Actinomycetes bacterium]
MTTAALRPSHRLHGLDALRAGALLLGILFHGLLPYVPGFPWMLQDRSTSPVAAVVSAWAHLFRMPLFMLLAGFFARMSLGRRGVRGFIKDRLKRIALPFVAFWPLAVAPIAVVAMAYASRHPSPTPPQMPTDPLMAFTPGHLWFLWQLLGLYALLLTAQAVVTRVDRARRRDRALTALGDLLATPAGVVLASLPHLGAIGLQGWRTFAVEGSATIRPELPQYLAFGGAFLAGWLLYGRPERLQRISRGWAGYTAAALAWTVAWFAMIGTGFSERRIPMPDVLTGVFGALGVYLWVYASLALAVRFLSGESRTTRYLADSSYWLYLMHLVVITGIGLLQVDLPWPWWVKISLSCGGTVALLLGTYELWVRHTWLGRWLNGRSYPRRRHGVEVG